jgi:uncharacterized protein YciU (UPF0263 family)
MSQNTTNYGNQRIVFDFHQEARSRGFNDAFCDILPYGVYTGGSLTCLNGNLIQIGEMSVIIRSNEMDDVALKITTIEPQELVVEYTKPYIVLRFGWTDNDNNFMDMRAVGWSIDPFEVDEDKLWPLDIILGKVQFTDRSGVPIIDLDNPFDLSRRKDVFLKEAENVYTQFRVSASENSPKKVYISGGRVNTSRGRFIIPGGDYPSTDVPDTAAQSRTDLIVINASGQIQMVQGNPSAANPAPAPKYGTYKVCAEIRRGPNRNDIKGSDIIQLVDASRRGQWLAEDFPLEDVENYLPVNSKNIEAAFSYVFHHSYVMSPDDPLVLAKVLRKHINFGTSDPDGVYARSIPVKDTEKLFTGADVEAVLAEIAGPGRTIENLKNLADAIEVLNEYAADTAADLADHIAETIDGGNPVHGLTVVTDLNFPLE